MLKYFVYIRTFISRFTYYMLSFIYFKLISHALLHQKKPIRTKFTTVTGLKQIKIRKIKMQWKVIHIENMPYMPENVLCAFILFSS